MSDRQDLQDLIRTIVSEALQKVQERPREQRVYRDEPILQRASQLLAKDDVPAKYRQLRRLAVDPEARRHSASWLFCRQGAFMADFEDDCPYHGEFVHYYPTYRDMTIPQQRGYFTWRTQLRAGHLQPTCRAFAFLYIYELINQIGVSDPLDGFTKLQRFWREYRRLDDCVDPYLRTWLRDYIIYYGLDSALLAEMGDTVFEQTLQVLLHPEQCPDEKLFDALCALSSYRLENGRLYKQYPVETRAVACGVFRRMTTYFAEHRKNTLCEKLFGRTVTAPFQIFDAAIFYDRLRYQDYTYTVNELRSYHCQKGVWSATRLLARPGKSAELGEMLRDVDYLLRQRLGVKPAIQPGKTTKLTRSLVEKELEIQDRQRQQEIRQSRQAAARVALDLSRLEDIRRNADATCDLLVAEEETPFSPSADAAFAAAAPNKHGLTPPTGPRAGVDAPPSGAVRVDDAAQTPPAYLADAALPTADTTPPVDTTSPAPSRPAPPPSASAPLAAVPPPVAAPSTPPGGLTAAEHRLLCALLYTPDAPLPLPPGVTVALLCDGINEKLFDTFGDTVLLFDGDAPRPAEDYLPELRQMFPSP